MRGNLRPYVIKLVIFALFTLSVTALLAAVIGNVQPFTDFYSVKGEFSDATGLLKADLVKVAGVTVGKVVGAEVHGQNALVTMQIRKDVKLPQSVRAAIRYRNLVGVRMIVIEPDTAKPQTPLLPTNGKGLIPISQTSPALDLGVVFNNLRPVLAKLNPEDANLLSRSIVKIFAGREQQVQKLVADLADLSQSLGDRGPVIANLIRDLNAVVVNLAQHDTELQSVLSSFDQLLTTLAAHSTELGRAVENVGSSSNRLADLIANNRTQLDAAIGQLRSVLALVAAHKTDLDVTLQRLPATTHALNRATTYGSWANLVIMCVNGGAVGPACPAPSAAASGSLSNILNLPAELK